MHFRHILFFICFFSLAACKHENLSVYDLRCENLVDPEGIANTAPRFSWKMKSDKNGASQQSYQILVASSRKLLNEGKADLWDTDKQSSVSSVLVPYEGKKLSSRSVGYWKVCVWDENGNTCWSETAKFSVGLLDKNDWTADYIALPVTELPAGVDHESPQLRKTFDWQGTGEATALHVNSLGYHELWLNGKKVTDVVLAPAVSQFGKRSLINTYDVTSYLQKGQNELILWLGKGWYRPFWGGDYYNAPVVRAQLDVLDDGQWETLVVTDASWTGRNSGYSGTGNWRPHRFGGEVIDGSLLLADLTHASLEKVKWSPVTKVDIPEHEVSPQMSEPNLITERLKPQKVTQVDDSTFMIDMGKNLTGWFEIKFPELSAKQVITLEYCDFIEGFPKKRQTDLYIASGNGRETFHNKFNYHAFRYVKISGLTREPAIEDISAYLIQTGFRQTSSFACSDTDMNAIHDMVQRTLRCLSLGGYLVDCPHIERLGYGGDGNASTPTAQTMFDLSPLYANWLQAWADCVRPDGGMPHTAPNPYDAGGGPYWCGFIITASWNTYMNYGDRYPLEKYYPVMQQWLSYVEHYSPEGLLQRWPDTDYRGWFLGDWAVPEGVDQKAEASVSLVNNCFVVQCYETMSKIARTLGKMNDTKAYAQKTEQLKKLVHQTFYDDTKKSYATGSQIDLTYPMLARVSSDAVTADVTKSLYQEILQNRNGHFATGLVGVPIFTEWAVEDQASELMYSMLKKRDYPGYLYMIDNGATTTWEHWNGDRSHIHNCYNGIGTWFYQAIGGIRPDKEFPAYRQFYVQPQIPEGITWAKTSKETPYGTIHIDWTLEKGLLKMNIIVPTGCTAKLVLPEKVVDYSLDGQKMTLKGASFATIESGNYHVSYQISGL